MKSKDPELRCKTLVARKYIANSSRRAYFITEGPCQNELSLAAMRMGAEGIKVQVSGRLNGAEMARSEDDMKMVGRTYFTLFEQILTTLFLRLANELIGIKVWICRGIITKKT